MNICKTLIGTLLIFVLIGTASGSGGGATITVCLSGCEYSSIQKAIKASSNGDTILVQSGTYFENVKVNKKLTLRGIGMPVVDARGSGSSITLAANGITLEGFTATGGGYYPKAGIKVTSSSNTLIGNKASNNGNGIVMVSSNNNTLSGNNASNNGNYFGSGYSGILLYGSNNNTLSGNNASNNGNGISVSYSSNNTLSNNNALNNSEGISLEWSNNNKLIGNNASTNKIGIRLYGSSYNTLSGNNANLNNGNGIGISLVSSSNNTLTGNNANLNKGYYGYGISLESSSNNKLIGNNASNNEIYGIYLWNSSNNTMSDNMMTNFNLDGYTDSDFDNNIDTSNLVDGRPIYYIIKDSDTKYDSSTNTGTLYCISCLNVTIKNLNLKGIYFWNTSQSRIQNVTASNKGIGIHLSSSSSNTLSGNNGGIYLYSSSNNTLSGNNASKNSVGISLQSYSNNNNLSGNNASNNGIGISLSGSSSNILSGNNASNNNDDGIYLESSSKNSLRNNVMTGNRYNFRLTGYSDSASDFQNQIDKSNLVNGKPIYYIKGAVNTIYDSSTNAGTFYCINCLNVTLKDLNLTNNGYGVFFWKTTLSKIQNVNASKNEIGIHLSSSSNNNTLDGNHAFKNSAGISLSDYSSNNTLRNNNASNNVNKYGGFGIGLSYSSNNTLSNNIASNNGYKYSSFGISLWYSSNNMLKGNNASNNRYGIQISTDREGEDGDADNSCTNNTLKNNIMTGNMYNFDLDVHRFGNEQNEIDKSNLVDGKQIYYIIGASNTIYDSSTNAGTFYCIDCLNVTLRNLNLTNNGDGVFFWNTTLSKIQNVKAYNNSDYGIYLYYSSNNTLSSNKASNNYGGGIYLYSSSRNKLSKNNASNNGGDYYAGITLSASNNNKIYNNIFKNTNNVLSFYSKNNKWNTTRQLGTNIIGGPYIGGNFWANPDGKGFSQKCTDENNDGICDAQYKIDSKNIDYLPLAATKLTLISPNGG